MGTFDISRINFDAKKHYKSVRMQQGRVLIDDDWNENERIENEDERQTKVDIIGPFGSPDDGFRIAEPSAGFNNGGVIDFGITAGTLYLGGLRLELEANETYRLQKDWLQQPPQSDMVPAVTDFGPTGRFDLVYIEAWQQGVTAVEDGSLFEAALNGADTTGRVRNMRRVHLASDIGFCDCVDAWAKFAGSNSINNKFEQTTDARLKVTFSNTGLPEDLCTPNSASGYLGAENQAIRVQLVDSTHFTWGFDNASPLYKVTVDANRKTVTILTPPKDQYHWPLHNQVVEILPWSVILSNGEKVAEEMGHLSKVDDSYDPVKGTFSLLKLLPPPPSPMPTPPPVPLYDFGWYWGARSDVKTWPHMDPKDPYPEYFYMRIWNRGSDLSDDDSISFNTGTPVDLGNTGLQVTIDGKNLIANDYWVIAARPKTPSRVVPWDLETGMAPNGVRRFFAPLAVIQWTNVANVPTAKIMHDCRRTFNPLTADDCCCTYTVGDGVQSHGDFNSIQDAVDSLPGRGGKICVLPGEHKANVVISGLRQIHISGCGDQTIVRPGDNGHNNPIFLISNSQKIQIENLTLYAADNIAIALVDDENANMLSDSIRINNNQIIALVNAINVQTVPTNNQDDNIFIVYNNIGMIDDERGGVAIYCQADKVLIERNRIVVIQLIPTDNPNNPANPDDGGDPFNPCRDASGDNGPGVSLAYRIYLLMKYVRLFIPLMGNIGYKTMGGIQIGLFSERVRIVQNEIIGGRGAGIILGGRSLPVTNSSYTGLSTTNTDISSYSALYQIAIEGNLITQMGLSGISSASLNNYTNDAGKTQNVLINDVTIYRNVLMGCSTQVTANDLAGAEKSPVFGGVILDSCENVTIQENRIENNGSSIGIPICGIYIAYGEKIIITDNQILNNGFSDSTPNIMPGTRGGIVIAMTFIPGVLIDSIPSFNGAPALKVHDNIVVQPLGHALFAVAYGPVSVEGNQFTSLGIDPNNVFSKLAASVFIFDLGVTKDLFLTGILDLIYVTQVNTNDQKTPNLQLLLTLAFLPNGNVMFSGNQTMFDTRLGTKKDNFAFSSQLIFSLDDVAFSTNQSECASVWTLDRQNANTILINTVLFAASARSNDNRFLDGFGTKVSFSLFSFGHMNTAIGNEASNCLIVLGKNQTLIPYTSLNVVLNNGSCDDNAAYIKKVFSM